MLTKINKINHFRIFHDYSWPSDLNSFKKYNVIFGWNGSGKTTLSNLFRQIELKTAYPDCADFEIHTTSGPINKQNMIESSLMIKVYNQDFRDKNISFTTCDANPIFFLGTDSIEIQEKLDKYHADFFSLTKILNDKKEELRLEEKSLDNLSSAFYKDCSSRRRSLRI